jgi:hypothetical protein
MYVSRPICNVFKVHNINMAWFNITRLDEGHLHSKLEVPGRTDMSWPESKPGLHVRGEHSRKEPFEQLVNTVLMSARTVENARYIRIFFS